MQRNLTPTPTHIHKTAQNSLIYILDIDMFHVGNVSHVISITFFGTAHVFHVLVLEYVCAPPDSAFLPFKPSTGLGSVYE